VRAVSHYGTALAILDLSGIRSRSNLPIVPRIPLERTRSRFGKLSSRAVLFTGGVALAWLIVAGLLILQLDAEGYLGDSPVVSPPITAVSEAPRSSPDWESPDHEIDKTLAAEEHGDSTPAVDAPQSEVTAPTAPETAAPREPGPLLSDSSGSPLSHPSLRDATDEPITHEVAALFNAIHVGLERPGATIDPSLANYVNALVARMNTHGEPLVVRMRDQNLEIARRRAVRAHALLVEAGMRPWLLEVFGERGAGGVSVERG